MNIEKFIFEENKNILDDLQNLPPVLYINLDICKERNNYMINLFKKYNIVNYTRIKGIDGKKDKDKYIKSKINDGKTLFKDEEIKYTTHAEYGCSASHIKAIKYFYEEIDSNYCIICEDDISFDLLKFYDKPLNEYLKELPYDFDICNLINTDFNDKKTELIKYKHLKHFMTCIYLISKKGAKKILDECYNYELNKIDFTNINDVAADIMLYNTLDNVYVYGLFIFRLNNDSTIHESHLDSHKQIYKHNKKKWMLNYLFN